MYEPGEASLSGAQQPGSWVFLEHCRLLWTISVLQPHSGAGSSCADAWEGSLAYNQ